MTDREIAELRRRFRPDRTNITHICGCYVGSNREIISTFRQSVGLAPEEETEKFLALFKRVLTGAQGRNLIDITFRTQQVADGDEHRLLSSLRNSALEDSEALDGFYQTVAASLSLETNYVILLAHEVYDVPYRGKDGGSLDDASEHQFSYIVCCICPVKQAKPALTYQPEEPSFHLRRTDWSVAAPELGFLFPAFDGRAANLYNALYYTHSAGDLHEDFIEAVFRTEPPMAAEEQKQTFQALLSNTLDEACSYEVVQTVHGQLCELIAEHKASRDPEPLLVTKGQMESVLESCGLEKSRVEQFGQEFDREFGPDTPLPPGNIVDARQLEVHTPDVTIRVNPERRDLVETRVIGGAKYILIRADDTVEVNGVNIHIRE